jgi:hypothetical protein
MRMRPPRVASGATLEGSSVTGPVVPEGSYTARLTKDGTTLTATIRLAADPASPHEEADRKLQQRTVMRLYQLIERIAFVSSAVGEARDQARDRAGLARSTAGGRSPDEQLAGRLEALATDLDGFAGLMVSGKPPATGASVPVESRLRELTGELYGEVSRYGGRPTHSQISRADALERETEKVASEFDRVLSRALDDLNSELRAAKLAPITPLSKEAFDKRPR